MVEPNITALALVVFATLLALSVLSSRASGRLGIPLALVFIALGMLAGSEGIGRIPFEDYHFAFRIGTVALTLILFDGGLNTPLASFRRSLKPASVLATAGVALTAAITALAARLFGFTWPEAFLLGAVVSSTDAAAVFSVLRGSGLQLKQQVGTTLELESGLNDPLAVILTVAATQGLSTGSWSPALLVQIPLQIALGAGMGLGLGLVARHLLVRLRLPAGGLYAVLTLALALLGFGLPTLLYGSGFLAVYVLGVVLGNAHIPYRAGVLRVHDAAAWFSQITMYLLLGMLVFPSRLLEVAWQGLALAFVLAFVARPAAVLLCLWPFKRPWREVTYVAWVGLRGSVPIILATYPILAAVPGAERVFDVVFFIVVASAVVPGATVRWATHRLGLEAHGAAAPPAAIEINSLQPLEGEILGFHIDQACAVAGATVAALPFPERAAAMLIIRGKRLLAPKGPTTIEPGDYVYIFAQPEDRALIELLFGRRQEE